jgi:hypothetical protein
MRRIDPTWWARWFFISTALLVLLVVVPCTLSLIKQRYLQTSSFFWVNASFWTPTAGGLICGFLWMVIVAGLAPDRKIAAAAITFPPGAWLAWQLIGETRFHIADHAGYDWLTRVPVFVSWWAGLLGLAVMWFIVKRRPSPGRSKLPPRRVRDYAALGLSVVLLCGLVLPAVVMMAQWALYHAAVHAFKVGPDAKALRCVQRLDAVTGFDLEWTPSRILKRIPSGFNLDDKLFGCPSCRQVGTPLIEFAARSGRVETVRWMVGRRGGVEMWNDRGRSLLDAGVFSGNPDLVDLLIERGADVTAGDRMAGGVLNYAVLAKAPVAILERLLKAGAAVNGGSGVRMTPLDCAHIWEPYAIPLLKAHGATNILVRDHLIPIESDKTLYLFEGTSFGIRLPEGFAPWNRLQASADYRAWEVRNEAWSSLTFQLGREAKPKGLSTTFAGFAAVVAYGEDREVTTLSIAFDTSGATREEMEKAGKPPRYDAILQYKAYSRKDRKILEDGVHSFFDLNNSSISNRLNFETMK